MSMFTACQLPERPEYTVVFYSNGGSLVPSQKVKEGEKAVEPARPTKSGQSFEGWYVDPALSTLHDFNSPITTDTSLYARWGTSDLRNLGIVKQSDPALTAFVASSDVAVLSIPSRIVDPSSSLTFRLRRSGGGDPPASLSVDSSGKLDVSSSIATSDAGNYEIVISGKEGSGYIGTTTVGFTITVNNAALNELNISKRGDLTLVALRESLDNEVLILPNTGGNTANFFTFVLRTAADANPPFSLSVDAEGRIDATAGITIAHAGNYRITVTGRNGFTGTSTVDFTITVQAQGVNGITKKNDLTLQAFRASQDNEVLAIPSDITDVEASLSFTLLTSQGNPPPASLSIGTDGKIDVTAAISSADAGNYQITVTGRNLYTGTTTIPFSITIASQTVTSLGIQKRSDIAVSAQTASNDNQVLFIPSSIGDVPASFDFALSTSTNLQPPAAMSIGTDGRIDVTAAISITDAGSYRITITGKGSYTGTQDVLFTLRVYPASSVYILNDSGITWRGNYPSGNQADCSTDSSGTPVNAEQDCDAGRDSITSLSKKGAGSAGFDFTKLDEYGIPLPVQNGQWKGYTGTAAQGTKWSCVLDNVSGLMWEVKTDDGGIHDRDNLYRWGGVTSIGQAAAATREGLYYSDSDTLVNSTNSSQLCGFNDWRIPTLIELANIANYGVKNTAIDRNYFPNTISNAYWTASPFAANNDYAWALSFSYGQDRSSLLRSARWHVRLVRGGQRENGNTASAVGAQEVKAYIQNEWPDSRYVNNGDGTVRDTKTRLVWKICLEGQTYTAGSCNTGGNAGTYTWREALERAGTSSFATQSDWRVPTIKELRSIIAFDRHNPSINAAVFPSTVSGRHWTSSPFLDDDRKSWSLSFDQGEDDYIDRDTRLYLRLVRGGE